MTFQSTPPCGGDKNPFCPDKKCQISIHAPLRGRRASSAYPASSASFQSTPPCGGDFGFTFTSSPALRFQSTPPCGGDPPTADDKQAFEISIHAPLRGRPAPRVALLIIARISIHAPLRGRPVSRSHQTSKRHFNPRPLAGATGHDLWPRTGHYISIHAPLRGRPGKRRPGELVSDFNPRPLAGATDTVKYIYRYPKFQSTPPCGGDIFTVMALTDGIYFNPRPLAGATCVRCLHSQRSMNFNPRPLAGATPGRSFCPVPRMDFNPRPLAGATGVRPIYRFRCRISIHAPLRGRLRRISYLSCSGSLFQSTPPCGGDLRRRTKNG